MKSKLFLFFGFAALMACTEAVYETSAWGIEYSATNTRYSSAGIIDQQNSAASVTHVVNMAYVQPLEGKRYQLLYELSGGMTLQFEVVKNTVDQNFHSSASEDENVLVKAVLNGEILSLKESFISIQPRTGENKLATVINLHTMEVGDWSGTVSNIPLVRSVED